MGTKRERSSVHVIVEGEAVRHSILALLESVGIQVETFSSLQTFLDEGLAKEPACVVTKVVMGRTSGIELLLELQRLKKLIPVILFLDHAEEEMTSETITLGSYGYLQKPFAPSSFLQLIRTILNSDRQSL